MSELTHFDIEGNAIMVDVSDKASTERTASAAATVYMDSSTLELIQEKKIHKGDVLSVAQIAGITAAKRTPDLIPLCHILNLTSVTVELKPDPKRAAIDIVSTCKLHGKTGVEMEALTSVSVTALTIYDMCKAVDRKIKISDIRLINKSGGKSGVFERD